MPIYDNLSQKNIVTIFPTWEEFWEEAKKYALDATLSNKDKVSFHFVAWQWYHYWKEDEFIGIPKRTVAKILAHLGTGFISLNKREQLYLKLFPKIEEQFKLIEIKSTEKGKDKVDKKIETRNVKRIISKLEPQFSLPDLISEAYGSHVKGIFPDDKFKSRSDWTQSSSEISEGLKTAEGIAPNYSKERGILLDKDFTRITKQQPQQQVARLLQCYPLVEYSLVAFLQEFSGYFDSWASMPENWTLDNLVSGKLFKEDYQPRPAISEEEREKSKEKTTKKAKASQWQDLSEDEWKEIHHIGEEVHMPTWYLEYLWRSYNRLKENVGKQKGGTAEKTARAMETIEKLIETFYGEIYWSSLDNYDKEMSQIVGFKEFKAELRNQIEVAGRRKKLRQVFYVLLGKPGVGKSEICQRLAKALRRPIIIINVGGMKNVSELEGKPPSWSAATYGKIVEAYVDKSFLLKYTLKDLEEEVNKIKNRGEKVLTSWEKERISTLELEINEWKKENEKRKKKGQKIIKEKSKGGRSRAPIILFDEFEKASQQEILDKIGNITDRKLNWTFVDKFLNVRIDLSEALILLTANYLSKVPEFVKDRCKPVNIELLTYQQRKQVLDLMASEMCEEDQLGELRPLISEKFLEMCITETWGIRGGINNLVATNDFLELMEVRGVINEIKDLAVYNAYEETEIEGINGYLKRQEGIMRLIFNTSKGKQELVLTRRLAQEINPDTKQEENVLEMVNDWPANYWWGGYRFNQLEI